MRRDQARPASRGNSFCTPDWLDFRLPKAHCRCMIRPWTERRAEAARHVVAGRRIIERQHRLIARQRDLGHDTVASVSLLHRFQRTQAIFESDLAAINAEAI